MTAEKVPFAKGDLVVYPTHGVGKITAIETQEIAGHTHVCGLCEGKARKEVARFSERKPMRVETVVASSQRVQPIP